MHEVDRDRLLTEIAERERVEDALRQSEERYRSLVAATTSVVWTADATGAFSVQQLSWEEYTGQAWEAHRGWGWVDAVHPDDLATKQGTWERALADRSVYESEGRLWHVASGRYRYCVTRGVPLLHADGSIREWVGTVTDVDERRRIELENERLYTEAHDAVRAREQFVTLASHELKTPLTSIKGVAQLIARRLQQQPDPPPAIVRLVEQLQSEVERLQTLVADLLDVARIQQGRLALHVEQVDLAELVRTVVARFEIAPELTPRHQLRIEAADGIVGHWDPARIDQVLTNLVSNALKYSPDGGDVRIGIGREPGSAVVAVSDPGIGIAPEDQEHLFEPFTRSVAAREAARGSGLGLHIVAQIVERHGGTIQVASRLGAGSTFTIRLPLAAPNADRP
jgi:PAS domain S-box-containing protein